jgi:helicase
MELKLIRESESPKNDLSLMLQKLHTEGPTSGDILEALSYFKEFHSDVFQEFEENIISALGIFYKLPTPNNVYSFLMSGFGNQHNTQYGEYLTPVQASIRRATESNQFTSFSAPTSAGKSYSIRELIASGEGDAVIVVPSRALIAEYMDSIIRRFQHDKNVMISSFVDHVFTSRSLRRIFVLTPERTKELYKLKQSLNIGIFFFDEAQLSDEKERGLIFDVMVRRVKKHFPDSKLIFAHPFVENPDAQFSKHNFEEEKCFSKSYPYGSVGKICVFKHSTNEKCYYFSPHISKGHRVKNCVEFRGSFRDFALCGEHSILVYVSKSSIYKGVFTDGFEEYIESLPIIEDENGMETIEKIQHMLGADIDTHRSKMVELLKKGVVIHHGSIPLEARFLIEDFIRSGHSTICFATSTLAQGINMPFDIVWIENNRLIGSESERALSFKNLIGRSGRMTAQEKFDYGYVYTNNPKLFSERISSTFTLQTESLIETCDPDEDDDKRELIEAIKENTLDEEKNIPISKVKRLNQADAIDSAKIFLDTIYSADSFRASIGGEHNEGKRQLAQECLRNIYEISLDRKLLKGELAVFTNAISILFHMIQGRSFREIVGIRYSYISDRDKRNGGFAQFSQPADKLPNNNHDHVFSLYVEGTPSMGVSYDAIVYDTYDYIDQVISFSLADVFVAAFQVYGDSNDDYRTENVIELFRYGTNNQTHILLIRYGFPPDLANEIGKYVDQIDERQISFKDSVKQAPFEIQELVEWYLP